MALRVLATPYGGGAIADSAALELVTRLLRKEDLTRWRQAACAPEVRDVDGAYDWLKNARRSDSLDALRGAEPVALDRDAMLALHVFHWGLF
jgi:hypothetical protein